ncbi:hypothetical protein A0H81_07597 [Grifola frondosa]|uniref:Methyltransferase domain-containing protein n=1 Tax=Grifola frondosa TaxID=5627 RepID=A0A1C7M5J0_GRIFR|nr:hypothetical protein A0H81_07597 [Grifola frondosa]
MAERGISRDVQEELLQGRARNRRDGEVPYPLRSSKELLMYDDWNNLFLNSLCRSITMHQFDKPPSMVLDLGCGGGLWVIEAAKQWPVSTIVGFDILDNQPNLRLHELELSDVAKRVSWVHGNLLEPLPFPSERFDFIRICCIGLGVPEDEWQFVLEEASRVMAPGGIIEIIEEDLIFPSGPRNGARTHRHLPSTSTVTSSQSSDHRVQSGRPPSKSITSTTSGASGSVTDTTSTEPPSLRSSFEIAQKLNPQDHTKLQMAWEEMLHHRFLSPRLLSVLPLYLSSTFRNIQTHPTLHILLPCNSHADNGIHKFDAEFADVSSLILDLSHSSRLSSDSSRRETSSMRSGQSATTTIAAWGSIHLARAVHMVQACKESIWTEYKALDELDRAQRSRKESDIREEFEAAWTNWESDMKDRMAMRGRLRDSLAWTEPQSSEPPDWRVWRERVGEVEVADTDSYYGPAQVCRSLRGFVCWKQTSTAGMVLHKYDGCHRLTLRTTLEVFLYSMERRGENSELL